MEISIEQYNKMASRLTELEYMVAEMRWIPVTERLPKESENVLITVDDGNVVIAHYYDFTDSEDGGIEWFSSDDFKEHPTAWMPLPMPWKGDGE